MFRSADLALINKLDLLSHPNIDLDRFLANLETVNPGVQRILTSATTSQGINAWTSWLLDRSESRVVNRE